MNIEKSSSERIFAGYAPKLYENGFSVIWAEGKATKLSYDKYRDQQASEAEFESWLESKPNANIGLPMGSANGLICLDIDFAELWKFEENRAVLMDWANQIARVVPQTQFIRRGLKPWAAFYKFENQLGGKLEANGIPVGEIIVRGQVIIPPSIHPDTQMPYVWVGGHDLCDYTRDEVQDIIPELSDLDIVKLKAELEVIVNPKLITKWPVKKDGSPGTGPSDIVSGRNQQLSKMAMAILEKGKSIDECADELLREDLRMHPSNPLFQDVDDYKGIPPRDAALKFSSSHYRTLEKAHARLGVAMPNVEEIKADRQALNVIVNQLSEEIVAGDYVPANLECNEKHVPYSSVDNVMRALEHIPSVKHEIWFDDFYQKIFAQGRNGQIREWSDVDDVNLTIAIQRNTPLNTVSESTVSRAVLAMAHANVRNAPRIWLESLRWDGTKRIENLFSSGFGASDSKYNRAASKNFLISMVARIMKPGCKVDTMVVLEGKQGKFKSTGLSVLGGAWFMESGEAMGSKDFLQSLPGKMLIEIAELDSFSKADTRTVKKTLSCRIDRYRPSYGRYSMDFPRQCVFVGTTNEDEYLEDATGGRRFWPIATDIIDIDWLIVNRDQLFAEAVARFLSGESWWEMPDEALLEQAQRRRKDAWEDSVRAWIKKKKLIVETDFTLILIAHEALSIDASKFNKSDQMRLANILKLVGATKKHTDTGNQWTISPIVKAVPEVQTKFDQVMDEIEAENQMNT